MAKILIILTMLVLVTLSCGIFSQSDAGENMIEVQPEVTDSVDRTIVETDPVPAEATKTPEVDEVQTLTPEEPAAEQLRLATWEQLDSFQLEWSWIQMDQDAAELARYTIIQRYDEASNASHIIVSTPDVGVFMETIVIGDQGWVSVAGTDVWMEMEVESGMEVVDLHDWGGFWAEADALEYAGEENINGVNCDHYVLGERGNFYLTNPKDSTMLGYVTEGEVWIANQPDLPPVDVRGRMKVREGFFPFPSGDDEEVGDLDMYWEYNLTNINQPVSIAAPE